MASTRTDRALKSKIESNGLGRTETGFAQPFRWGFLLALVPLLFCEPTHALILTGQGNAPVRDPGWPRGALAVANLESRAGWAEGPPFGGGQWTFFYRGDRVALQKALDAFAGIDSDRLEVVLHAGGGSSPFLAGGYDWSFEVWVPTNWDRLYNDPHGFFSAQSPNFRQLVAGPRLDLWLSPGRLEWEELKLPAKLILKDTRATAHGFKAGAGSAIRVMVSDAQTGRPIKAAKLILSSNRDGKSYQTVAEAIGNEDGRVELSGLTEDTYRIAVSADGYAPRVLAYSQIGSNDFSEFATDLAKPTELAGVVLDQNEAPLSGVTIKAMNTLGLDGHGYTPPETSETISDSNGQFRLRGLPKGSLQVWAFSPGYHHRWNPAELVNLAPGAAGSSNYVVHMEATGTVRIQILDASGNPVQRLREGEIQVHIEPATGAAIGSSGGSANVSTNGVYEFAQVPPGEYRVSLKPFLPGLKAPTDDVTVVSVAAGKTAEVKLVQR
jgi:hypothetical protein